MFIFDLTSWLTGLLNWVSAREQTYLECTRFLSFLLLKDERKKEKESKRKAKRSKFHLDLIWFCDSIWLLVSPFLPACLLASLSVAGICIYLVLILSSSLVPWFARSLLFFTRTRLFVLSWLSLSSIRKAKYFESTRIFTPLFSGLSLHFSSVLKLHM